MINQEQLQHLDQDELGYYYLSLRRINDLQYNKVSRDKAKAEIEKLEKRIKERIFNL